MFFRARGGMGNTIYLLDFVREPWCASGGGGANARQVKNITFFQDFSVAPLPWEKAFLRIFQPVEPRFAKIHE